MLLDGRETKNQITEKLKRKIKKKKLKLKEVMESFEKQTFRNRCRIVDRQGRAILLTVPVRQVEHKQLTRDIAISNQSPWQHQHWQAIRSAYEHTPYFMYFADLIQPIYERPWHWLIDLNDTTLQLATAISLRRITPQGVIKQPNRIRHTTDWSGEQWTDSHPWQQEISILDRLFKDGY